MIVRRASHFDFDFYFKLETEFMKYNNLNSEKWHKYSISKKGLKVSFNKKLITKNSLFLIAFDEEKPIGYLYGYVENKKSNGYFPNVPNVGYLENVFILKNHRGKGVFSSFMKEFITFLGKHEVKHCALHVDAKNSIAIAAYEKFGFKIQEYKMVAKF